MSIMNVLCFALFSLYTTCRADTLSEERVALRAEMREVSSKMDQEQRDLESKAVREKLFKIPEYQSAKRVATYLNRPTQVDTNEIVKKMVEEKKKVFIPKEFVDGIDMVLINGTSDLTDLKLNLRGIRAPEAKDLRLEALGSDEEVDTRRYPDDRGITQYPNPYTSKYFPEFKAPKQPPRHHVYQSNE